MTDRADLESRVFLAIAKTMPTKQPAAVLDEIQKTHYLVPKDPSTCADFDAETLESFTSAIDCEVELSGGYLGAGDPQVFAVHCLSWLEDHGFRMITTDPEPIRQNAAKSDTSETTR